MVNSKRLSCLPSMSMWLLLVIATGCEQNWHADPQPTSGKITINGSPPENAFIIFKRLEGRVDPAGTDPFALTNADGSFRMTTYKSGDGVPTGKYAVCVMWPKSLGADSPDRLNDAYSKPEKAVMQIEIKPGENIIPTIQLENIVLK